MLSQSKVHTGFLVVREVCLVLCSSLLLVEELPLVRNRRSDRKLHPQTEWQRLRPLLYKCGKYAIYRGHFDDSRKVSVIIVFSWVDERESCRTMTMSDEMSSILTQISRARASTSISPHSFIQIMTHLPLSHKMVSRSRGWNWYHDIVTHCRVHQNCLERLTNVIYRQRQNSTARPMLRRLTNKVMSIIVISYV